MSSLTSEAANADPLYRFWHDTLEDSDPEVAAIIGRELGRQRHRIELIASENIASPAVLEATGSVFTTLPGPPATSSGAPHCSVPYSGSSPSGVSRGAMNWSARATV